MRKLILVALKILSATLGGKQACCSSSMMAGQLLGLVKVTNSKLNTILPSEKESTAMPETLLRCLGNCDHRQFSTATELIDKSDTGSSKQQKPSTKRLIFRFTISGTTANSSPHARMTSLYPNFRLSVVAINMAMTEGTIVQSRRMELVRAVISVPLFLRQEKKQMLVAPQIPQIPAANLMRIVPRRVRIEERSASRNIFSIIGLGQILQRQSYGRSFRKQTRKSQDGYR